MQQIDRTRLAELMAREQALFAASHPKSKALSEQAKAHLFAGVPLTWMREWQSPFTVFAERAEGAVVIDVDGNDYADFCLGDTGAMFGHSPPPFADAVAKSITDGVTTMLPNEDAIWLGEELTRRFGLPYWSFALTATDANRFACRIARAITERPKILVFNGCYHGTLGEATVDLENGRVVRRETAAGIVEDPESTTRVVEFNDLDALDRALAHRDVACVLAEPALTNCSMVLPEPGFHDGLRDITRRHETLLIIDETHTISSGPGGYTKAQGLEPDLFTLGKPISGGIPAAVYGFSAEVAARAHKRLEEFAYFGTGIGGTLAANALSLRAMRVMFSEVITQASYDHMFAMAAELERGIAETIATHHLPWHVSRLGARVESGTGERPWKNATEVRLGRDRAVERFLHLFCLNRGVLITPFHNMLLTAPATTPAQVARHNAAFAEATAELVAA